MSYRYGAPRQPGAYSYGLGGLGALGASIPQEAGTHGPSLFYPGIDLPAEAADEFTYRWLTLPAGLAYFWWDEYGNTEAQGDPGRYSGVYEAYKNGVSYGSNEYIIDVGGVLHGAAATAPHGAAGAIESTPTGALYGSASTGAHGAAGVLSSAQPSVLSGVVAIEPFAVAGNLGVLPATVLTGTADLAPMGAAGLVAPADASILVGSGALAPWLAAGALGVAPPISIYRQPAAVSVEEGQYAVFSVGTDATHAQWRRDGIAVPGALGLSYTAGRVALADSGAVFDADLFSPNGSKRTASAALTVVPAQPDATAASGQRRLSVVPHNRIYRVPRTTERPTTEQPEGAE